MHLSSEIQFKKILFKAKLHGNNFLPPVFFTDPKARMHAFLMDFEEFFSDWKIGTIHV